MNKSKFDMNYVQSWIADICAEVAERHDLGTPKPGVVRIVDDFAEFDADLKAELEDRGRGANVQVDLIVRSPYVPRRPGWSNCRVTLRCNSEMTKLR